MTARQKGSAETEEKLSIVCFNGDFECAVAALMLATGAAVTNHEVPLFLTSGA
jgi:peroxiredoxin family protein